MSDYKGAALLLPSLPKAKALLADRGYDADWFRQALIRKGIVPCIPPKRIGKFPSHTTKPSINKGTKLKIGSGGSRIGGALPCAMIGAPIPSSQPFLSPPS